MSEIECSKCRGCGWMRIGVEPSHPDFGKLVACPACGPERQARKIAALTDRLWQSEGDDWSHYRDMTLDTYPWTSQTQAARPILERWLRDDPRWLLLHGPYRRGKTGLAVSLVRELVNRGLPSLLVTVPHLLDRIRSTYSPGSEASEADVVDSLIKVPVLLLDDLGAEKASEWVWEKVYTIINGRLLAHRRTIFTTNIDPEEALEKLGQRVMWRVLEMCGKYVLKIDGPNLSKLQAAGGEQ